MEAVVPVLSTLLVRAPELIVLVVGIVLAIVRRRRDPRAATLGLVGFLLALLALLLSSASSLLAFLLPQLVRQISLGATGYSAIFAVTGILSGLVHAAAWIMIIIALFTGRAPVETEPSSGRHAAPDRPAA